MSGGLIRFGLYRCAERLRQNLKDKKKLESNPKTISSSNVPPDTSTLGFSGTNSPPGPCKKLNGGATNGTKYQIFGPKWHFSVTRDNIYQDIFLRLGYPGLHAWRIVHQLYKEDGHQILPSGRFSITHQIGIPSSYWSIDRRSEPQLVKGVLHQTVPGYALGYNARPTHQAIKKVVRICSPRSPARLFGVLSLVVSFDNLSCVY